MPRGEWLTGHYPHCPGSMVAMGDQLMTSSEDESVHQAVNETVIHVLFLVSLFNQSELVSLLTE